MDPLNLMIPGPVEVAEDVLSWMAQPIVAHYGAEWVEIYNETVNCLKHIFRTDHDIFIIVGSGSAALDAGVNGLLDSGDRVILAINGFFGQRLREMALSYGADVVPVVAEWGKPVTAEMVEEAVQSHGDAKAVIAVHSETSTGVVNPVEQIGEVARKYGLVFMVDAVTSLGGMDFDMDGWGVDVAVTASQKCLEAPPGLAAIAVSPKAWRTMEQRKSPPRGWYLNLLNWRDYKDRWGDWHPYPITMATNNVLALRASVRSILKEGLDNRMRKHERAAGMVREGVRKIGLDLVVDDEFASSTVTAVRTRPGVPSGQLIDFLKKKHRIQIANGLGQTRDKWFRIGHLGSRATSSEAIGRLLAGIEEFYCSGREANSGED